jgi:hypothetical protein
MTDRQVVAEPANGEPRIVFDEPILEEHL